MDNYKKIKVLAEINNELVRFAQELQKEQVQQNQIEKMARIRYNSGLVQTMEESRKEAEELTKTGSNGGIPSLTDPNEYEEEYGKLRGKINLLLEKMPLRYEMTKYFVEHSTRKPRTKPEELSRLAMKSFVDTLNHFGVKGLGLTFDFNLEKTIGGE